MQIPQYDFVTTKTLSEEKALYSHKVNQVLSSGCIYTFGLWILFLLTILFIQKVF